MKARRYLLVLIVLLLVAVVPIASAQDTSASSGVQITWPLPVSQVSGTINITGTASIPNMAYYYVEAIAVGLDNIPSEDAPWLPITPGFSDPVVDGTLATVDTEQAPDGIYAIRLVVLQDNPEQGHPPFSYVVSPIRVSNDDNSAPPSPTVPTPSAPTPAPPTPNPEDNSPRVSPDPQYRSVNVRYCDIVDNDQCPIIDTLHRLETAAVLGISSRGTGFYQARVPDGNVGWISPTVVVPVGDFSGVPFVSPPTPLPVPPPAPTEPDATVVPNGIQIVGGTATCGQTFNVNVNVGNTGSEPSNPGNVTLQDIAVRTGSITYTGYGSYPSIAPGQNFVVVIPVTVTTYFNEQHELRATNDGSQFSIFYTLAQGSC